MAKKVPVQGMVPESLKEEITRICDERDLSVSEFVWLMLAMSVKERLYERFTLEPPGERF